MSTVTIERGIAFFEDGTEVSNVSIDLIKRVPAIMKALKQLADVCEDDDQYPIHTETARQVLDLDFILDKEI